MIGRIVRGLPRTVQQRLVAVEQRIRLAHWIGRTAVEMGGREVQRRVGEALRPSVDTTTMSAGASSPAAGAGTGATTSSEPSATSDERTVPFDGYDDLTATQLVPLLERVDAATLRLVRDYEAGHRGRRTVLGKVDQLLAAS